MGEVINLEGTHGTSTSRFKKINQKGFNKSKGRLGKGAYFWVNGEYAVYLAQSWWKYQQAKGHYSSDDDSSCVVIIATLKTEEKYFIDLTSDRFKEGLAKLCKENDIGDTNNNDEIASLIDLYIQTIEATFGHQFKILKNTIPAPKGKYCKEYPKGVLGHPQGYIVFDTTCITIKRP